MRHAFWTSSISLGFMVILFSNMGIHQFFTPETDEDSVPLTPVPTETPSAGFPAPSSPEEVPQIFEVVFSSDSLFDAISSVFEEVSSIEIDLLVRETSQLTGIFTGLLHPPEDAYYATVAASSFRTAAALGPVLFMIRLSLFHWNRLIAEDDRLMNVLGDWVSAGFSAVIAGPFLDILVRTGWWVAGTVLGETSILARDFLSVTMVTNLLRSLPNASRGSIFSTLFAVSGGLGGLVGAAGLVYAFAISQAVLFIMSLLAPVVAIIAVLPQTRWLRALWLKAVAVLALLPVAAGGIFKAAVALAISIEGSGFANLFMRISWLWGAAGFMLSLAGILGKFSLTAAIDTATKLVSSVQAVVTTALLASSPVGSMSLQGGATSAPIMPFGTSLERSGVSTSLSGASDLVLTGSASRFQSPSDFDRGFDAITPYLIEKGFDPGWVRDAFPEDTARLVNAYLHYPDQIQNAADPLETAAKLGGVPRLNDLIAGRGGMA